MRSPLHNMVHADNKFIFQATAMKKLFQDIKNPEAFYTALIENSNEAISVTDENFSIVYRSHSADSMTGWTTEERAQGGGIDQTHPEDVEGLKLVMKEVTSKSAQSNSGVISDKA